MKAYPICAPFDGTIGTSFTRSFEPEFFAGLKGRSDSYATYEKHLSGKCVGMVKPSTAAQLAANPLHTATLEQHVGNGLQIRESVRSFDTRDDSIIADYR